MSASTAWWLAAGVLVAAELATGTFYLLMLAIGAAAGALAAHAALPETAQVGCAAVLGGGAVVLWHVWRRRGAPALRASANPDVVLDIGGTVHVTHWHADGTARAHYRGADWDVRYLGTDHPSAGDHRIQAVEGNCLLLDKPGAPRA